MVTVRPNNPFQARIAQLIQQGFIMPLQDGALLLTMKGLRVLMACAEPHVKRPPKKVRISGD